LAASSHLTALRSLNLSFTRPGEAGLVALSRSPFVSRLHYLGLADTSARPHGQGHRILGNALAPGCRVGYWALSSAGVRQEMQDAYGDRLIAE
jgi:hypothetical protein